MGKPDLLSPEFMRDPYPIYKTMRDDFPLFYHEGMMSYVISRFDDIARALSEPALSNSSYQRLLEPVYGRTIIQMDGKEHAAHRNLVAPTFRARELREKFLKVIEETALEAIDGFRDRGEVDLVEEFTSPFPINVIVRILGLPRTDYRRFRGWTASLISFLSNFAQDPAVAEAGLRTRRECFEYITPVIEQRRREPGEDLISLLCAAEVQGERLTDDAIRGFCIALLVGGGESTDRSLSSLFKNLLEHPDQLARVQEDRALIDRALAENLRFSPPGHLLMRVATEDIPIAGGTIPAGSQVACAIAAANRDERRYKQADAFDIFREDLDVERAFTGGGSHLAFGHGRHFCLGAALAKMEMQVAVGLLLDAMKDIRFANGAPPPEIGFFVRSPRTMPLRFTPSVGRAA